MKDCCSDLDFPSSNLPSHFRLAIGYGDLSRTNALAGPRTGEITGIIDHTEAGIQPFGFALYAVENMLGHRAP